MTHPPIAQQITWVYAEDLAKAVAFYAEALGFETALVQGNCRVYRSSATSFLGLCKVRPGRHVEPKGVVITMVTDDVDGWHSRLKARGADLLGPPERNTRDNIYGFFARDPNGYLIEFQQFLGSDWPRA